MPTKLEKDCFSLARLIKWEGSDLTFTEAWSGFCPVHLKLSRNTPINGWRKRIRRRGKREGRSGKSEVIPIKNLAGCP